MAKPRYSRVVLFVLINKGKILLEKRPIKGYSEHQYLIPGGTINAEGESLENALKREMMEELSITPIEFELLTKEEIPGLYNHILIPFIVKKWEGEIPLVVLDKEDPYPLEWVEIDSRTNNPIDPSRRIIQLLEEYLKP